MTLQATLSNPKTAAAVSDRLHRRRSRHDRARHPRAARGRARHRARSIAPARRKDPRRKRATAGRGRSRRALPARRRGAGNRRRLSTGSARHGPKVLDASTAHRVAPGWAYGFAELEAGQRDAIAAARARRQSRLLSDRRHRADPPAGRCRPAAGRLSRHASTPSAATSGGGKRHDRGLRGAARRRPSSSTGSASSTSTCRSCRRYAGLTRRPIFIPSVGNFRQGMLVEVPLHLDALPGKPEARGSRGGAGRAYAGASS